MNDLARTTRQIGTIIQRARKKRGLRETRYRGEPVVAIFENLLPDSDALRFRVAEKVGARGIDAYSLLSIIGRDCVGALQFMAGDDEEIDSTGTIEGEIVDEVAIEKILK